MAHTEIDFTYQEAVRTLGVTPEMLDHLIDEGKISVISTPAQLLVPRESILRYLATVTTIGKEKKKAPAKEAAAKAAPAPKAEVPAAEAAATDVSNEAQAAAVEAPAAEATAAPVAESAPEAEAATPEAAKEATE